MIFTWRQRLLFFPPVIIGVLLIVFSFGMKAKPPAAPVSSQAKPVRILEIQPRNIQPLAVGYGKTRPAREWEAQAEMEGILVTIADKVQTGAFLPAGSEIMQIDPSLYQLTLTQYQAQLSVAELRDNTIRSSIVIAEQETRLQENEYLRSVRLRKTGSISQTQLEQTHRALLSSQQQLQTLRNNLAINKEERKVLESQIAVAERNLDHTRIYAPFDLRVTEKLVNLGEYVNKGENLLKADGTASVEVDAQFPLGRMRPLRKHTSPDAPVMDHSNLLATVELEVGDRVIQWSGNVTRTGGLIDAQTQSQTIIIGIDHPYEVARPGQRPPLIRDTFVKVILKAPELTEQIILPVEAIHNHLVYVVDKQNKMHTRQVKIDFIQDQVAVIAEGLAFGEKVILSDLSPAVENMPVKAIPDKQAMQWLDKQAALSDSAKGKRELP